MKAWTSPLWWLHWFLILVSGCGMKLCQKKWAAVWMQNFFMMIRVNMFLCPSHGHSSFGSMLPLKWQLLYMMVLASVFKNWQRLKCCNLQVSHKYQSLFMAFEYCRMRCYMANDFFLLLIQFLLTMLQNWSTWSTNFFFKANGLVSAMPVMASTLFSPPLPKMNFIKEDCIMKCYPMQCLTPVNSPPFTS